MNPLCISRLIESGYCVALPIGDDNTIIIARPGGQWIDCLCQNASQDSDSSPIFRVPLPVQLCAVCDRVTRTVWLLPPSIMEDRTILRLGNRYEEYILPEPLSLSSSEQKEERTEKMKALKDEARRTAEHAVTGE